MKHLLLGVVERVSWTGGCCLVYSLPRLALACTAIYRTHLNCDQPYWGNSVQSIPRKLANWNKSDAPAAAAAMVRIKQPSTDRKLTHAVLSAVSLSLLIYRLSTMLTVCKLAGGSWNDTVIDACRRSTCCFCSPLPSCFRLCSVRSYVAVNWNTYIHRPTNKFLTRPTCQIASESGALRLTYLLI